MRKITDKLYYGDYKFIVELNTRAEMGTNQLTVWVAEKRDTSDVPLSVLAAGLFHFSPEEYLRSFYFEEADNAHIHDFCRKFALDTDYRRQVLAGEIHWIKRDELFVRNLRASLGEDALSLHGGDFDQKAHTLFHWLDAYAEEIQALPEYQRIQEIDDAPLSVEDGIDPLIRSAIEMLNRIPGVTTQFSCQGVSGKVRFQDRDLLVISAHEEYAFVSFSELGQSAHDAIVALLPEFPGITNARIPFNFALYSVLRSTGDNRRFCEELAVLAERVLTSVDENWNTQPRRDETLYRKEGVYTVQSRQTAKPGGILPSQLAWLCQPEHIERTLYLLFHLNHWIREPDHLLYADRQGLYKVKATVLQQAYAAGLIKPVAYIDESESFASEYFIDLAAYMATERFIDELAASFEDEEFHNDKDEVNGYARKLFVRIMGYEVATQAHVEALDKQQVKRYIEKYLENLVAEARSTRQPIPTSDLAALFIDPLDLFQKSRGRLWLAWDDLDESEVRKLDPEGLSLVTFQYDSPTAHYVFHLPFRVAEAFLSEQHKHELLDSPGNSQEHAVFDGHTITEVESQKYPIDTILSELQVDIAAVCPYGLIQKREHLLQLTPYWASIEEDEDEDEEYWMDKCCDDLEMKEHSTVQVNSKPM